MIVTYAWAVAICKRYERQYTDHGQGVHFWARPLEDKVYLEEIRIRVNGDWAFPMSRSNRFMAGSMVAYSEECMRKWLT